MLSIEIPADTGDSTVFIDNYSKDFLKELINNNDIFIISDENVYDLYKNLFPTEKYIVIDSGEKNKKIETVEFIIKNMIETGCTRNTFLLGFGGGIVTDISGFTASVFMRGINFGFVSTTLLSQVDASVGGKNGVNCGKFKNMIGIFNQPQFVYCCPEFIQSLTEQEYYSGLGEVLKHALIADHKMFVEIENQIDKVKSRDETLLTHLIHESVNIKAEIVKKDPREKSLRKLLNFGHTLGHAVELSNNISHGHAVVYGMKYASYLSYKLNYLSKIDFDRINLLFNNLNYNLSINIDVDSTIEILKHDKKRINNEIDFILLNKIGDAFIKKINFETIRGVLYDMC